MLDRKEKSTKMNKPKNKKCIFLNVKRHCFTIGSISKSQFKNVFVVSVQQTVNDLLELASQSISKE